MVSVRDPGQDERRPHRAGAPLTSAQDTSIIPDDTDARLARARRHDYAVLVLAERADGIVVSQVYQHLSAAERRVRRTRERNLAASMHLVRLVPVPWSAAVDLALDELGGEER